MERAKPQAKVSLVRRLLGILDPAEPGFFRRIIGCLGILVLLVLCGGLVVLARLSRTPTGRFWTGVVLLETGQDDAAVNVARRLVSEHPGEDYDYYRLLATALRRTGQTAEQLGVLDEAVRTLPDDFSAHGHRCWYGALFGDAAAVLDSCDRAVELSDARRPNPIFWRAAARVLAGDREGAIADFETVLAMWERSGHGNQEYRAAARRWLETLRAGGNPLDEETLARVRKWF